MIMELPKKFKLSTAEVIDEKLVIYQLTRYEDLVYELTYALKSRKCIYCGKELTRRNCTLDHRFPRFTGGVSITNNLFPCCPKCNSDKGNLLHEEYLEYRKLSDKEKRKYLLDRMVKKENLMRQKGFKLPKSWVTYVNIDAIRYCRPSDELRGKKYNRILEFYTKYHNLPGPVIIDKNNYLLDGYNLLLFARDFEIHNIPAIKLDNVEIMNKKKHKA